MNRTDSRRSKNYFLLTMLILMPMGPSPATHVFDHLSTIRR
jgi:hypothetical protein